MKNLKEYIVNENNFFKNLGIGQESQIRKWCDEHKIKNYVINSDLTIDVNGEVDLNYYEKEQLPEYIQFGKVSNDFFIGNCKNLTTLKGCPQKVTKTFSCCKCPKLKSLECGPQEVGGSFYCHECNDLISLKGAPQYIGYSFYCNDCPNLESLEGSPQEVGGIFGCEGCGKQFTKDDVKKVCKVKRRISV